VNVYEQQGLVWHVCVCVCVCVCVVLRHVPYCDHLIGKRAKNLFRTSCQIILYDCF
jgi:hypothetical protein